MKSLFAVASSLYNPDSLQHFDDPTVYRGSNSRINDIIHTSLKVSFDWQKSRLYGEAEIIAKPYFKPSDKLFLNARGMDLASVEVYEHRNARPGTKLNSSYKYSHDTISIDLGRTFSSNENYCVKIKYTAKPDELTLGGSTAISSDKGLFFINPKGTDKNKMPQVWTQGETQSNSTWFPTIDSPNEKMTSEIYMTVEDKYTTLSNGLLVDSKKNGDGTRTDHWDMDLPHSPYLVMMAVGEFKKVTDVPWNGKEISYYVEKEYEPYAKDIFGDTKEMIDFFSAKLGVPYPWQKYSQVVVRDYVSGAMENTNATLHGDFMVYQTSRDMLDGKKGEDVISHELFHQWFGDLVTAESWSNLPLNESFATYGEYLWQEYKHGREAADALSYNSRSEYMNSSLGKEVDLIRFHYNDREEMFDAFSYNKGGQVLHMLRKYVGDDAFFASLKLYLERNKFKNAEIHDLRLAFEEVTGEDLNWFFNQWFLAKGYPILEITKDYDAATGKLTLKVRQSQDLRQFPLYTLPVYVDIYTGEKTQREKIWINRQEQEFMFNVSTQPQLVNFDGERQLLCRKKFNRSTEELLYQYSHAPLFADRMDAVYSLAGEVKKNQVYEMMVKAITSDTWPSIRTGALNNLKPLAKEREKELMPLLIKVVRNDKDNSVRAATINFLALNYQSAELEQLYKELLNEKSYLILRSALEALGATNGGEAVKAAKKLETEKSREIKDGVAFVYGMGGSDEQAKYFHDQVSQMGDSGDPEFIYFYFRLIARCKQLSTFEMFFDDLVLLSKNDNKYLAEYASGLTKKEFRDLLATMPDESATGENFKPLKEKVFLAGKN